MDPSSIALSEAFAAASQGLPAALPDLAIKGGKSSWPVLAFLGFIFSAPYLIMKLIGSVSQTALEECKCLYKKKILYYTFVFFYFCVAKNPITWVNPIKASVMHDFDAVNPHELNLRAGQSILIAPREIQNTQKLIGTGWILASLDSQTSGLIPINYVTGPKQISTNNIINEPDINGLVDQEQYQTKMSQSQTFNGIGDFPIDINSI